MRKIMTQREFKFQVPQPPEENSKMYAVDLDFPKNLFMDKRHKVSKVWWRISPSGKGFHFRWYCNVNPKLCCPVCEMMKLWLDDPARMERDRLRPFDARNVLWDKKGERLSGRWYMVTNDVKLTKTYPGRSK